MQASKWVPHKRRRRASVTGCVHPCTQSHFPQRLPRWSTPCANAVRFRRICAVERIGQAQRHRCAPLQGSTRGRMTKPRSSWSIPLATQCCRLLGRRSILLATRCCRLLGRRASAVLPENGATGSMIVWAHRCHGCWPAQTAAKASLGRQIRVSLRRTLRAPRLIACWAGQKPRPRHARVRPVNLCSRSSRLRSAF